MFQAPYYNRSIRYDIRSFKDHALQNLMALFVSKKQPELVRQMKSMARFYREDLFFNEFTRFVTKYINFETLPVDVTIYFRSSAEQKAGTQLGCGGTGDKSRSYAKSFRDANAQSVKSHIAMTEYFEEKYDAVIRGTKDERLFLDESGLWDKIADEKYVMPTKWLSVVETAYEDATLASPIPANVDKQLVPLAIRNRVVQKHNNATRRCCSSSVRRPNRNDDEEEEEDCTKRAVSAVPGHFIKIELDEETRRILEEEDW